MAVTVADPAVGTAMPAWQVSHPSQDAMFAPAMDSFRSPKV